MLTREQILAAARPRTREVDVPAWGGKVMIRELTVADAAGLTGQRTEDRNVTARIVALSLCDAEGRLMFTEEDVGAFAARRGSAAINALAAAILDFNGLTAAAAEDIAKN